MTRRSIRSFTDEKIAMEEFRKILDAARLALQALTFKAGDS